MTKKTTKKLITEEPKEPTVVKGFKGFNENLKCRDFQYEVGKEYEMDGPVAACERGFHFCEHPLDVFNYYPPAGNRFCEVVGSGEISKHGDDSKVASSKIHISAEITLESITKAAVKFVFDRAKWSKEPQFYVTKDNEAATASGDQGAATASGTRGAATASGDQGAATASGYQGAATASGDQGAATASGYQGAATASGYQGAAVSLGIGAKAKGMKGTWLTIAEWKQDKDWTWQRIDIQTIKVDGEIIKENTFYQLVKGKFTELS